MSSLVAAADHNVIGHSQCDSRGVAVQAALQQHKRARDVAMWAGANTAAREARVAALQVEFERDTSTHHPLASALEGTLGSNLWRWSTALGPLDAGSGGLDR